MTTDPAAHQRAVLHAEICKVLTDPKRLLLLRALRSADRTVGELAAEIGASLPNASQHLAVLRGAGLVDGRREGASVRYRLAEPAIVDACDIVEGIVDRRLSGRRTLPVDVQGGPVAATAGDARQGSPATPH